MKATEPSRSPACRTPAISHRLRDNARLNYVLIVFIVTYFNPPSALCEKLSLLDQLRSLAHSTPVFAMLSIVRRVSTERFS